MRSLTLSLTFAALAAGLSQPAAAASTKPAAGEFVLISSTADGVPGNRPSRQPVISRDGRKVAFVSAASNLVPGDTNNAEDVFVKEIGTGNIRRVSVHADGSQTAKRRDSYAPVFSPDGRKIYFVSEDSGFVAGDTNGAPDIFEKDLKSGKVTRVSLNSSGEELNGPSDRPSISRNGRYLVFDTPADNVVSNDGNGTYDVFQRDLKTGKVKRLSLARNGGDANGPSFFGSMSPNGRSVVFESYASNIVANDKNEGPDIFTRALGTGKNKRVSASDGGTEGTFGEQPPVSQAGPVFSPDNRDVAFETSANDLGLDGNPDGADVFIKTLANGDILNATRSKNFAVGSRTTTTPRYSLDGNWLVFSSNSRRLTVGGQNDRTHVYARDLKAEDEEEEDDPRPIIVRLSQTKGAAAGAGVSTEPFAGPKRLVAFVTTAGNLVEGAGSSRAQVVVTRLP